MSAKPASQDASRRPRRRAPRRIAGAVALLALQALQAAGAQTLADRLAQRFEGDRTGLCVVAAVVDRDGVKRAGYCARDGAAPEGAAFEIGSVAKTMTAFLVAELVEHGVWSLDDPIARHLPAGAAVPRFDGAEIRVRHLLTHTAGLPPLPPGMAPRDPLDPYADLTPAALVDALGRTRLTAAPGSGAPAYSNFGMMLLSLAVARAHGGDLEAALRGKLFAPLGMAGAAVRKPAGADWVQGRSPAGAPTPAWTVAPELAGVGMVRATLDDMVKYLQAQLGIGPAEVTATMARTQQPLVAGVAMNWFLPTVASRRLVVHEGGTAGFSSLVAFDPEARKGVVMLADTGLADLGGLADAALPLLVDAVPLGSPRRALPTPPRWLKALPGDYLLPAANLRFKLWAEGEAIRAQAAGQAAQTLGYDSRGDFYPLAASYLLTPMAEDAGAVNRLVLRQGGGVMEAVRAGADTRPTAVNPVWRALAGEYALTPQFSIRVFEQAGRLMVQGTGQAAIAAEQTGPDRIEIREVGAVVEFQRNAAGDVTAARLLQGGQTLTGAKKP